MPISNFKEKRSNFYGHHIAVGFVVTDTKKETPKVYINYDAK